MNNDIISALVVLPRWLDRMFDHNKDWEIRGVRTSKRGRILLIQSGSGMIVGETNLIDCIELDTVDFRASRKHHQIKTDALPYPRTYAWVLKDTKRYNKPIPYNHPQGAVIWVSLPSDIITREFR